MKTTTEILKKNGFTNDMLLPTHLVQSLMVEYAQQVIDRCAEKTGELFKDSDLDFLFEGVKKELT